LTFDDGSADHRDLVAETLMKRRITASFFVVSSLIGLDRRRLSLGGKQGCFMSARDLQDLAASGFDLGAHSHTHVMLGRRTREQVTDEVRRSKEIIEGILGRPVFSFAYPYGRDRAFFPTMRTILEETGYRIAFTQEGSNIDAATDVFFVPRLSIDGSDTRRTFLRKLKGQYHLLSVARRLLRKSTRAVANAD
jgi:peptidoglycan/xylan/chitin deacetylase (PgdA/CDA1 family)